MLRISEAAAAIGLATLQPHGPPRLEEPMWKWAVIFAGVLLATGFAQEQQGTKPAQSEEAPSCTPFKKAKELVGKEGCVVGRVRSVTESQAGNTFVNFCSDYHGCSFSAVSLKRDDTQLGDLHDLEGKVVEFRGTVEEYQGQAEIKLKSREQMTLTKDKAEYEDNLEEEDPHESRRMHNFGNKPRISGGFGRRRH